jgi:hypothetical protein
MDGIYLIVLAPHYWHPLAENNQMLFDTTNPLARRNHALKYIRVVGKYQHSWPEVGGRRKTSGRRVVVRLRSRE